MKRPDLAKGIVFLFFSFVVIYESLALPLGNARRPGPGFFPLFLGVIFGVLSLVFLISKGFKTEKQEILSWSDGNKKQVFVIFGILISYAVVFSSLGYIISTFLLMFFFLNLAYPGKWVSTGVASFLVSIMFFVIFQLFLKIQLPVGILGI